MTEEKLRKKLRAADVQIEYYNKKVENKTKFWKPDQIEKWKIERYKYIKIKKELKEEYPEYFL